MKRINIFLLIVILGLTGCATTPNMSEETDEIQTDEIQTDEAQSYSQEIFGKDIIKIDITVDEADWDYLMENAQSKPYISADISVDGVEFKSVGLKTKGNSSLSSVVRSESQRYSLKLNFDKYIDNQSLYGLDKLALNNIFSDNTYMKEILSYELFDYMQVPASLCTYADIYINGEQYGFYLAVEDVDDDYFERHFGTDYSGEAYKPESMEMDDRIKFNPDNVAKDMDMYIREYKSTGPIEGMPGGGLRGGSGGVSLVYTDDNTESYSSIFENEISNTDEEDHKRLIASLKAISEGDNLEQYINVDEVLRYTAVNVFLVNLDSYFSQMGHNYILYEEDGLLSMLPWDYNMSFGGNSINNSSDAVNYPIDTIFKDVSEEERPLISKLLEINEYKESYYQYLNQLVEYVNTGAFTERVNQIFLLIDEYVENDTSSFVNYSEFLSAVEALNKFIELRAESVTGQLDGSIPSTFDEQKGSDDLINASQLNMDTLGGMGGRENRR